MHGIHMHLIDISMFYAMEGGGVSTYLNAKARWFSEHGKVTHTILSSSVGAGGGHANVLALPSFAIPGLHGYRLPLSVGSAARMLCRLRPDLIEAGDACHSAWAALRAGHRLYVPVVVF